jgi:hypothetical protein
VSKWITEKNLDVESVLEPIYDRANRQYGMNEKRR